MILKRIKSLFIIVIIWFQKMFDICYRLILGTPRLKRSQITAQLFLGGQYSLVGLQKLKDMGITAIVNMRETSLYTAPIEGFKYLHLPTVDNTPPTIKDLNRGAIFVDEEIKNNGKVYIHCRQGLGRGPSMAIAYLLKLGITYEDAFALVKSVRSFIKPRPEQIIRLKELEQYYKKEELLRSKIKI